jgi:probable rRNA maturation factor
LLNIFGSTFEVKEGLLKRVSKEAFLYLKRDFEINLRFVSEKKIRELNRIYRNRDLATDILSFSLDKEVLGGDIVICYKEAQFQAKKLQIKISDAACILLAHGILHLAGFEHTKTIDRDRMEKAEIKILSNVGINLER